MLDKPRACGPRTLDKRTIEYVTERPVVDVFNINLEPRIAYSHLPEPFALFCQVRKSMARIKYVLNERRLALIEAQKQVREAVPAPEPSASGSLFEEAPDEDIPPSATTSA